MLDVFLLRCTHYYCYYGNIIMLLWQALLNNSHFYHMANHDFASRGINGMFRLYLVTSGVVLVAILCSHCSHSL